MKRTWRFAGLVVLTWLLCAGLACAGEVFDGILKKGELVVGITGTQPPLNATAKNGEVIGLDADIARAVADGMKVKVRFARMPFPELLPALQAGKVDMVISGVTMTPERNTRVAFVGPYLVSGKGILLKLSTVEKLKKDGLNSESFKVATLKGSTSQAIVEKAAPKAGLTLTGSYEEALALLFEEKVDVVVADYPFCAYMATRHADKKLVVGESKLSFEPLGIAVREDALLINALDNFLAVMVASGDMKELQEKWLKSRSWFDQLP